MALSRIWAAFIIVSILVASIKCAFFPGDRNVFSEMVTGRTGDTIRIAQPQPAATSSQPVPALQPGSASSQPVPALQPGSASQPTAAPSQPSPTYRIQTADGLIRTCETAVTLSLGLIGIMALFMGLIGIADRAGGIRLLSRIVGPFFSRLFPELPKNHPAMGHMVMNFSANMLGLDNAATPFALKAMQSLQEINPHKETASNSQIMFLCLHQSGLQLIPVSVIAIRASMRASDPTDVFIPILIATFVATLASMLIVAFKQRINVFQPVIMAWVGGFSLLIIALVIYFRQLPADKVQTVSQLLSNGLILLIFVLIVGGALYKKINMFDAFVEGAKGGFDTAVKIIPYLVGILVAISMLRTSGTFDAIIEALRHLFTALGTDTRFVDGLPTALIKPLSGSGARGMMIAAMQGPQGPNSFAGRLSGILQGSSDATFYIIAVYFGAVSIKNTRYSIGAMLLTNLVSIIVSIFLCYLFFGHST